MFEILAFSEQLYGRTQELIAKICLIQHGRADCIAYGISRRYERGVRHKLVDIFLDIEPHSLRNLDRDKNPMLFLFIDWNFTFHAEGFR